MVLLLVTYICSIIPSSHFVRSHRYPDEPSFILPKCLKDKVAAGDLGRKSGKGFYNWDGDKRGDPVA